MDEGGGFSLTGLVFGPGAIVLQVLALIHAVKRRPEGYWYLIILMGGGVGALVYIVVEIVPDFVLIPNFFAGMNRKARIPIVEAALVDNPSPANYEELGELYWEQKQYAKARENFDRSISTRSDSIHTFYHRAQCSLEMGDTDRAIEDFERVVQKQQDFDYHRAALLLAHAYGLQDKKDAADAWFREVTIYNTTPEALFLYAQFLRNAGRRLDAREWAQKTLDKKKTLPRYQQRRERPWFARAKTLLKETQTA